MRLCRKLDLQAPGPNEVSEPAVGRGCAWRDSGAYVSLHLANSVHTQGMLIRKDGSTWLKQISCMIMVWE